MSLDPKKLFVVTATSRAGIAEDLNDYIDSNEVLTDERLTPDDDRLSDDLCTTYAAEYGDILAESDDLIESELDEKFCDLYDKYLRLVGVVLAQAS